METKKETSLKHLSPSYSSTAFDSGYRIDLLDKNDATTTSTRLSNANRHTNVLKAYRERISELLAFAEEDALSLNPESKNDLLAFFDSQNTVRKGNLVLLDNGNLRATWRGDQGGFVGLQFLGNNNVQFVILENRSDDLSNSRAVGRISYERILQQIAVFDLNKLVCE